MSMPPLLRAFAEQHTSRVLTEIKQFFASKKKEAKEVSPHLLHSIEVLEEFVARGGKHIRPLLVILGYHLAGGQSNAIYRVAAGIELCHKHLLSIDDIGDRDELRNGGETIWLQYQHEFVKKAWQSPEHLARTMAEIDAVFLGTCSFELVRMAEFPAEFLLNVVALMNQIMYWKVVGGWQLQYYQNQEKIADVSEADFLHGLELVTAHYTFIAPLEIGVAVAGRSGDEKLKKCLREYGLAVGRGFQLQDDILGVFGDPKETGKPVGNDIREGKKTLLIQHAYQKASQADRDFLDQVCGRGELSPAELGRVQQVIKETGSLQYSQDLARRSVAEGVQALEMLPESKEKALLVELAEFVIARES